MTAPVPALSTSADVETVLAAHQFVARTFDDGLEGCWWACSCGAEGQRGRWKRRYAEHLHRQHVAAEVAAALSTPPTEGRRWRGDRCADCGPGYHYGDDGCRHTPPGVPGAVGAGSAVKADIAKELLSDTDLLTPNHDGTPEWYALAADDVPTLVGRILAISQDAARTSRGGALRNDEREALAEALWLIDGGDEALAARATRPAPDDQTEEER